MFIVGGDTSDPREAPVPDHLRCMWLGIAQVRPGAHLGDIGHAIQKHAEGNGFSVVREFCGHGIGANFHEDPRCCTTASPAPASNSSPA